MDARELERAVRKALAEVKRRREMYSTCMLTSDIDGCREEQQALADAQKRLAALQHKLAEAERRS